MIEALIEFLKGPFLKFAIIMAILGILRSIFIHTRLLILAFYNARLSWKEYGRLIKRIFVLTLPNSVIRLPKVTVSNIYIFLLYAITLILPFFILYHTVLIEVKLGITLIALSKDVIFWVVLAGLIQIAFHLTRFIIGSRLVLNNSLEIFYWLVFFTLYLSGMCSTCINDLYLVQITQFIHVLLGDLLILSIPFTRIGYWITLPIARVTSHLGMYLLPASTSRNETETYFKEIMENR